MIRNATVLHWVGEAAYIRVGPETRRWQAGKCLLYDTTVSDPYTALLSFVCS
jgi:Aspartyl/Asparaginyl beta-hydroxylase